MYRCAGILLILLLLAALAVSGCSGSSDKMTTLTVASQLYSLDRVHWYAYNGSGTNDNGTMLLKVRYEYGYETYKGTAALHTRIIANGTMILPEDVEGQDRNYSEIRALMPDLMNISYVIDVYTSKANDSDLIGARCAMRFMGIPMEQELNESQLQDVSEQASQYVDQSKSRAPLTKTGQETITVGGAAYDCTKYNFTADYAGMTIPYTVWNAPQAPVPVRMVYTMSANNSVPMYYSLDLSGWG